MLLIHIVRALFFTLDKVHWLGGIELRGAGGGGEGKRRIGMVPWGRRVASAVDITPKTGRCRSLSLVKVGAIVAVRFITISQIGGCAVPTGLHVQVDTLLELSSCLGLLYLKYKPLFGIEHSKSPQILSQHDTDHSWKPVMARLFLPVTSWRCSFSNVWQSFVRAALTKPNSFFEGARIDAAIVGAAQMVY